MTRLATLALGLLLLGLTAFAAPIAAQAGFTTLFDGKTLKGWNVVGNANWEVADGAVGASRGTGFLVTPMAYGDFQLIADIWVDADANSGIFIRLSDPKMITATNSYEVNIFDKRPDPAYRTGAIVNIAKPAAMIDAGGRWNTMDITAQGTHLMVTLNGTKTVDVQDNKFARGPIALQYGAGVVKFRNVRIRTL